MLRPKLNLVALDPGSGRTRPGAWFTLYFANTLSLAPLYADDDVTSLPNPSQADGLGVLPVRVNPGLYDVSITWEGALPTVMEDILAWTPEAAVIVEPGDLIVGAPGGGPERLPVGANGAMLRVVAGMPAWGPLAGGAGLPAGPLGTMLVYDPANTVAPLGPGTEGQMLAILGGEPTWVTHIPDPPGTLLPISARGDLVVGSTVGTPSRLPRGTTGQVLSVEADGDLAWIAPPDPTPPVPGFENPMTTLADLIVGAAAGAAARLGIGATGTVLTVVAGLPAWAAPAVRRIVETTLPLEGARLPDGSTGNLFPTPIEWINTTATPPATMPRIVSFAYQFAPLQQQSLLWKTLVPAGYSGGAVALVAKWRAPGITGQIRLRAAVGPVVDMGTDITTTLVFNPATVSAPQNLPGTANLQASLRLPLDQLANVAAGRTVHVMVGILESGADPGAIVLEQCWLEWTIDV